MRILFILLLTFAGFTASSQKITGIVKDDQAKGLSGANITLQRAKDSAIVKIATTNSSGRFEFINIKPGSYFIGYSYVSYRPAGQPCLK